MEPLTRREMVEKLLAGAAASVAWPLLASAHPIHSLAKNPAIFEQADAVQKAANWKPLFLDQHQDETLTIFAECIVPGSTEAQVNRFIDLLLSVDTSEHQKAFIAAIAAIDDKANKEFSRVFSGLTTNEREALLTDIVKPGLNREHFDHLKEWVTIAYYSSEQGMRELGWTENRAFRNFPECETAGKMKENVESDHDEA